MANKAISTKNKVAMKTSNGVLIVFGVLEGKQRAGTFAEADAALAKKAAAELGLSILDVADKATKELASKLRPGNAHANATGFLPAAPKAIYANLTGGTASKGKDSEPRRPPNWDDLSVGDIVVSQDTDPEDGWWYAKILLIKGDMCTLQWHTRSDKKSFKKHKFNVGLLWPGEDLDVVSLNAKGQSSVYPASWQSIDVGHLVVCPEQGPVQQSWNCRVTELIGDDRLKLRWDGYPHVGEFERPRHGVALIYPIPRVPAKRSKDS